MGSSATVRVPVIGVGAMTNRAHYPALAAVDDVVIAGICDLDAERLRAMADTYGIVGARRRISR